MKYTKSAGQTAAGPADWFTGAVFIDGVRNPDEQSAVGCSHVRFTPGARTAWHHHPKGQTLYVTDGIGLVSYRGGETVEIRQHRGEVRVEQVAIATEQLHRHHTEPLHRLEFVRLRCGRFQIDAEFGLERTGKRACRAGYRRC